MPRSINRCPNCNEPVSPFAAGCAICGADLEQARRQLAARKAQRPALPNMPSVSLGSASGAIDWLQVALAVALALFLSPLGLILGLYWAQKHRDGGNPTMMWLMLGAAALSVAAILAPVWFWSHIYGGL